MYIPDPVCHVSFPGTHSPVHLPTQLPFRVQHFSGMEVGVRIGSFSLGCLSLELAVSYQRGLCGRDGFELYLLNNVKRGRQKE